MADITNSANPLSVAITRAKYSFTIPESARSFQGDPKVVTLQQVTLGEEAAAEKRAETSKNLGSELLKAAVIAADGTPVTWDSGGKERFLEGLSPAVRQLIGSAYIKLHAPSAGDSADFLASMTVAA